MSDQCFAGPGCHTERSGRLREQFEGPDPEQQASIVTYLLMMQRPANIPDWTGHVHRIETPEDSERIDDMSDLIKRTITTRLANVETVFATLEAGATTIAEVIKRTGLGKKVVQRAMVALENDGRIIRVRAKAANQSHRFRVVVDTHNVEHDQLPEASSPGVRVDGPVGPQEER
jgi:hypothetical protein